ncbi:MAG: tetratricopeptide repeat protein [Gemmatimonadota bacterium]
MKIPSFRAGAVVALVAVAVYANTLGNGFAYDDPWVIEQNPLVSEGGPEDALDAPYWPKAAPGTGNYRPLTLMAFQLEWRLWGDSALGYHAVNVLLHAGVSVLVFVLLLSLTGKLGAFVGGLLFAVHPVHVEAVANGVGQSELLAALWFLLAVLLYRKRWSLSDPRARGSALFGLAALYAAGLGSKEIAVTLPGVLLLLEVYRDDRGRGREGSLLRRLLEAVPVLVVLTAVLGVYLLFRLSALGEVTGETPAAGLRSLSPGGRILTALTIWPHYLRLMVFPADLSMDYQPAVLLPTETVDLMVVIGAAVLAAVVGLAVALRERQPAAGLGFAWFVVTVLPVSNLVVRSDILLAERTLYLPSVGFVLTVAAVAVWVQAHGSRRDRLLAGAAAAAAGVALSVRTVTRNPTWMDTFTALQTLAQEHPESYMAVRARALGLERVGHIAEAREMYELALRLAPDAPGLRVEMGEFLSRHGDPAGADRIFRQAIREVPDLPVAYRRLAEHYLRTRRPREAFLIVVEGLRAVGADRELYALLSESYIAKGDLESATRARRAALGVDPTSRNDWRRLAEILEAMGRTEEAKVARAREAELPEPEKKPEVIE